MTETIAFHAPEAPFVEPYVKEALPGVAIVNEPAEAQLAVMVSSTDIYRRRDPAEVPVENSELDTASEWVARESAFAERFAGTPVLILRCPDIICTGMTGFGQTLARAVWRGTFFHFPANEARRSVVHATDIARVVAKAAAGGLPHRGVNIYNISDGVDPTIHDLAEAFAFRMSNKRISTMSTRPQQWLLRLAYGKRRTNLYTTSSLVDSSALRLDMAFAPTDVCNYLRTHLYDENSL